MIGNMTKWYQSKLQHLGPYGYCAKYEFYVQKIKLQVASQVLDKRPQWKFRKCCHVNEMTL